MKHIDKDASRKQETTEEDAEASAIRDVIDLPNIDARPSVLTDLEDILITDAEDGVAEEQFTETVGFGKPSDQSFVRCHPGADRVTRVWVIRNKSDMGKLFVVPKSLLPKLGPNCKRFILRQAITSIGVHSFGPHRSRPASRNSHPVPRT